MKVKMLCCSGKCISFPLIWAYQEWFRVLESSSTKSTTGSLPVCEFVCGSLQAPPQYFYYSRHPPIALTSSSSSQYFPVSSNVPFSLTHRLSAHASFGLELSKYWETISYAHLDRGIWFLPLKMDGALSYDCSSLGVHSRALDPLL